MERFDSYNNYALEAVRLLGSVGFAKSYKTLLEVKSRLRETNSLAFLWNEIVRINFHSNLMTLIIYVFMKVFCIMVIYFSSLSFPINPNNIDIF